MFVRTEVRLSPSARLSGAIWSLKAKGLLVLGRIHLALERGRHLLDASRASENKKQAGRLSAAEIAEITNFQTRKVGGDARKRAKIVCTDEAIRDPKQMQHKGCRLLKDFLEVNPGVRSVANIGARVDVTSSYLAPLFPDVQFISVDFQPDLAAHNAPLSQSKNWTFLSGYALDLFDRGELRADAVFMTSTACLFNNAELNALIDTMRLGGVKHVILNEPWWPAMKSVSVGIPRPEGVLIDSPIVSGSHGNYHPNYGAKLERGGYRVTTSKLINGPESMFYCLQIVASR